MLNYCITLRLAQKVEMDLKKISESKKFCILPWVHLHVMPDSTITPCCISPYNNIYGDGNKQSLKEILNSEKFKLLRNNMLHNIPSEGCQRCYELEDSGFISLRNEMNTGLAEYLPVIKDTLEDGSIKEISLKYLDIRFSNLCNFKCRGCGPTLSSAWYEDHQALHNYSSNEKKLKSISVNSPTFWNELKSLVPFADVIYFGGGEPLITKEHFEILSLLIKLERFHVKLRYNTNLSQINYGPYNLFEMWSKFDSVTLSISLDDIGLRAEYFRHGTKWEVIEKNILSLMVQAPKIERYINCTVNIMNVYFLPEIYQHFLKLGVISPERFHINLLLDPSEYRIDVLPPQLKRKVKNKLIKFQFYLLNLGILYKKAAKDIENILTFMDENDNSEKLVLFRSATLKLDELREESFKKTFPELLELLGG
jgi:MoaA/NifB/PqqE/SkfB family radical SAM enzyme